jgi:hypothetical protein
MWFENKLFYLPRQAWSSVNDLTRDHFLVVNKQVKKAHFNGRVSKAGCNRVLEQIYNDLDDPLLIQKQKALIGQMIFDHYSHAFGLC